LGLTKQKIDATIDYQLVIPIDQLSFTPNMKTIETQRLYRRIADQIREGIQAGKWALGSRLPPERDLAPLLGVSRPSLREALIALEVEGLIAVRTGSGIYVQATSGSGPGAGVEARAEWGPLEVMRARQVIEVEVAALAAQNARSAEIARMRDAIQLMRDDVAQHQAPRRGDEAFHLAIASACGNDVLTEMVEQTWAARDGAMFARFGDHFEHPVAWQHAIAEHDHVLSAIETGDAAGARRAMRQHIKQAIRRYTANWQVVNAQKSNGRESRNHD
jgi:DNA-binding FadR family transcriptional regulator